MVWCWIVDKLCRYGCLPYSLELLGAEGNPSAQGRKPGTHRQAGGGGSGALLPPPGRAAGGGTAGDCLCGVKAEQTRRMWKKAAQAGEVQTARRPGVAVPVSGGSG